MNKKLFFLPLLAAMGLTGCSSDEPTPTPVNGGEESYLAVTLAAPAGQVTRAATDGGFDEGSKDENAASKVTFLFFDAAGNAVQTPQTNDIEWNKDSAKDSPQVSVISKTVAVIAGNTAPAQMLVLLNAPTELVSELSNAPMVTVLAKANDYSAHTNGFLMTNSSYMSGDNVVTATSLADATFYSTKAAAEASDATPVEVYVERVLAKIVASCPDDGGKFTINTTDVDISGTVVKVKPVIMGIEVANIAKSSYLFKNIDGIQSLWAGANDADNFRFNWANSPSSVTYANASWSAINTANSFNESSKYSFYVQENTTQQHTAVLITAQLQDENGEPVTFVRWAGNYYNQDAFLAQYAQILNNAGYRTRSKESRTVSQIRSTDLRYLTTEEHEKYMDAKARENATEDDYLLGYETTVCLTEACAKDSDIVTVDPANANTYRDSSADNLNAFLLKKVNRVWLWNNGMCYYFANVEHYGPTAPFTEGVVRNHIYNLTLSSVSGVGVPVPDPEEDIIPEKPSDDLFYLAARINILKWKMVNQSVNFE
jgi:hypothetical protein